MRTLAVLLLFAAHVHAATITVRPVIVEPGGTVTVTVTGSPGHPKDWLGKYHATAIDQDHFSDWVYLNGTKTPTTGANSGVFTFTMPATEGEYNFRLYGDNSYSMISASAGVTVSIPFPNLPACTEERPLTPAQATIGAAYDATYDFSEPLTPDTIACCGIVNENNTTLTAYNAAKIGTCGSSVAVTGTVTARKFLLSPARKYVWGEYTFDVASVIRGAGIAPGQTITVTRAGGAVCTTTGTLHAKDDAERVLEVGSRYILFLTHKPAAGVWASSRYDWDVTNETSPRPAYLARTAPGISAGEIIANITAVTSCE